jgi:hypothetical protein
VNIDHTTIVVRERSIPELYDLTLLVCRRYLWPLFVLGIIGCAPFLLINWWLLAAPVTEKSWGYWYGLLLLLAIQGPFATAPITAYLGSALFDDQPRIGKSLRQAWKNWWALIVFGLWRGILGIFPFLLIFWPPHAVEVAVLEQQKLKSTWKRANALRAVWTSEWSIHLMVAGGLLAIGLFSLVDLASTLSSLFMHADLMGEDDGMINYLPNASIAPHMACWLILIFLAVVRFLAYIDLRTRREGWEIDLAIKREARRLGPTT